MAVLVYLSRDELLVQMAAWSYQRDDEARARAKLAEILADAGPLTIENYDRLVTGMPRETVIGLLGSSFDVSPFSTSGSERLIWRGRRDPSLVIIATFTNGKLTSKTGQNLPNAQY